MGERISTLKEKKRHYEEILRWELGGLDDEFETLVSRKSCPSGREGCVFNERRKKA